MADEVSLSAFFQMVRNHSSQCSSAGGAAIAETVATIVGEKGIDRIDLDVPFSEDVSENTVVDALVSSQQIEEICIHDTMEANFLLRLFRRVLGDMTSVKAIAFLGTPMSATEAKEVFWLLQRNENIQKLGFFVVEEYCDGVFDAFERYVRGFSSLTCLALGSYGRDVPFPLPEAQFGSICESIQQSSSLEVLLLGLNSSKVEQGTTTLASALVNSTSLTTLLVEQDVDRGWTMSRIEQALLRTPAIQNLELSFRTYEADNDGLVKMHLSRTNSWKNLFGNNHVPMSLWPRILAKANLWNRETSHSSRDVLFLLVKEKNDVLLQNVGKRKIRKRKRFQLT